MTKRYKESLVLSNLCLQSSVVLTFPEMDFRQVLSHGSYQEQQSYKLKSQKAVLSSSSSSSSSTFLTRAYSPAGASLAAIIQQFGTTL